MSRTRTLRLSPRVGRPPLPLAPIAGPVAVLGLCGGAALVVAVVRVAAGAAAGPGVAVPALWVPVLAALLKATGTGLDPLIGPGGSRPLFWLVLAVLAVPLLAAAGGVGVWVAGRGARLGDPRAALASRRDYRAMRGKDAAARARRLRPSLGQGPIAAADLGIRLGRTDPGGDDLYGSEEDSYLGYAGPRSNKTSAWCVPAVLTAPGPLIVTTNKVDIYMLTAALRARQGQLFVLDPQRIVGVAQSWWWNPLRYVRDIPDAARLMEHFVATIGGGTDRADPYFTRATARLLAQLSLAAAVGPQLSLRDVRRWLVRRSDVPAQLLDSHGYVDAAEGLRGLLESPEDQKGGVFETALTALGCLESEAVTRYVTPPRTWTEPPADPDSIREFDPWRFLVGYDRDLPRHTAGFDPMSGIVVESAPGPPGDSLYALTREGADSPAPMVAALVDQLLLAASVAASAQGGRVDPPVRGVLDEAANTCPIRHLADLYSYFGSMSIQLMTFLQNEAQAVGLWGRVGADKLWGAATVKLVGAATQDPDFCERISRLVGSHEVPTWSEHYGRGGYSSGSATREKRILDAADILALPPTHAVLFTTGRRAGVIKLLPWYTEPEAGTINRHAAAAAEEIRRAAIETLGPDNPLARYLAALTGEDYPA